MAQIILRFFPRLLLALGLLILVSCGKDSENSVAEKPLELPITSDVDFFQKISSTSYICEEAECPSYTVAVAVNNLGSLQPTWCTGTVLKNGQVLTSKSCFGDYFFESQTSCKDHVLIKNLSGKIFGCENFLETSPERNEAAKDSASKISDYVLMDIPGISANKFPVLSEEKGELFPGKKSSVWAINHWSESDLEVTLEHKKCFYQNKSLISPWGRENESSHLFLSKCEMTKSARGAAILDTKNAVSGIVHTVSTQQDLEIWDHRVLQGEVLAHYALGNSLACTKIGKNNFPYCDQKTYTDKKLSNLRNSIFTSFEELEALENTLKKEASADLDKYLRWTAQLRYVNEDLLYEVDFIPTCFTYADIWLLEFRGGLFNMFYDKSASVFKAWPDYKIYSGLDEHFNIKTDLQDTGELLYEIKFSPRDLKKHNKTNLTVFNTKQKILVAALKDVAFCQ